MMGYNTKNYFEQGGERMVIGGELAVTPEGMVSLRGVPLQPAACLVDTDDSPANLRDAFNALLLALKEAGLMERALLTIHAAGSNTVETATTYTNVAGLDNAWVVDAIVKTSEPIPAGTEITITNPAIGGTPFVMAASTDTLWLSDVIKGQLAAAPTRTQLNGHTTQALYFGVGGLAEALTTDITISIVASKTAGLAGTHQAAVDFCPYAVLTSKTVSGVTFAAEQ